MSDAITGTFTFFSSYSLRSRTSFVLVVRKEAHVYLWHGCKSSSDSRKTAKVAAGKIQERYLFSMFIVHVVVNITRCDHTDLISVFSGEPKNHPQNIRQKNQGYEDRNGRVKPGSH